MSFEGNKVKSLALDNYIFAIKIMHWQQAICFITWRYTLVKLMQDKMQVSYKSNICFDGV